jgi:hypothetical protein
VVPENEVVLDFYHALFVLRVVLLREEQQLRFNGCLVVVLLLVLDKLHGHKLLGLVIEALEHLAESTLSNLLDDLEAEANLIVLRDSVITVLVVVAIVHDALSFRWVDFVLIGSQVEDFLELAYLLLLQLS